MYTVNRQIIDTFRAYQDAPGFPALSGLSFSKSLWINGASAAASVVTISEDSATGGVYYLTYTPTVTGSHYVNLFNALAIFDADYYVTSGSEENAEAVWANSGTSVLSGLTASVNELLIAEAVWAYSTSGSAVTAGSMGKALSATHQVQIGKWQMTYNTLTLYEPDGSTILKQFTLYDLAGNQSITGVVRRDPV